MQDSERSGHYSGVSNQTFNAIPGIVVAGSAYAVLLTIGNFSFAWWQAGVLTTKAPAEVAVMLIIPIIFMFSLAIVAFISTIAMTLFNLTLGYAIPALTAGGLIGGFTGFIVAFLAVAAWSDGAPTRLEVTLIALLGPVMATVICHLGAHYQTRKFQFLLAAEALPRDRLSEQELSLAMKRFDASREESGQQSEESQHTIEVSKVHPLDEPDHSLPNPESHDSNLASQRTSSRSRLQGQWTIRQAFVLTTWFGLLAALAAWVPEAGTGLAIFFASYSIIQLLSFAVLFLIWKRLDRRVNRVIVRLFKHLREPDANRQM